MAHVYILQSLKNERFYIGSTDNIKERLKTHQSGNVKATQNLLPVRLVMKQEYPDLAIAKRIERKLKRLKHRDYIERIVRDQKIKMSGD